MTTSFVPHAARLDERGWCDVERIVDHALGQRPARVRRQVTAFIRLVEWLPMARWGRRFSALDAARRERLLRALQRAPMLLVRRGLWGVRTLAFMGYYGRPEAAAEIGYRADARGWEARR